MRSFHPPLSVLCMIVLLGTSSDLQAQTKREKKVGPLQESLGRPCDTTDWKLVFHDEFSDSTLDRSKWITWFPYSSDGSDQCEGCRIMGTSNTIFRDDLVQVQDGLLRLGVRAHSGTWYGKAKEHEGAIVHSTGDARFTYGRFEVRCRMPRGAGLWPAFWGFGGETEIDVFECCGEKPRILKAALHRWGTPKYSNGGSFKGTDLSRDFHTYAVEWEPDGIGWYIDGRLVHYRGRFVDRKGRPLPECPRAPGTYHTAPYFPRGTDGVNVILDLAVSGPNAFCKGPKRPLPWPEGTALEVDHVRVYQRHPQPGQADLCDRRPRLVWMSEGSGTLKPGGQQRLTIEGPHGEVTWSVSTGLTIVQQRADVLTVEATPDASGSQWVRAEAENDPCGMGPLKLEAQLVVER